MTELGVEKKILFPEKNIETIHTTVIMLLQLTILP